MDDPIVQNTQLPHHTPGEDPLTWFERVVDAVDRYAAQHGETRSGLLVRAVTAYIGRPDDRALKQAQRGRRKTKARGR